MTKRGELYIIGGLVSSTLVSGLILSSSAATAETYTKSALIRVQAACTMDGTVTTAHSATIAGGTYREGIGESIVSVACNDAGGFGVYAIGFTDDTDGNNVLAHGTENVSIATGTATSGNTSNWAMKLEAYENGNNTPTIENGYGSYKAVPDDYTLVASYPNATSATDDVIFRTYYSTYISMTQRAGTYTGKVKYVMVHPATGPAPQKQYSGDGFLDTNPDPTDPSVHTDGNNNEITWAGGTLARAYEVYYANTLHKGMYVPLGNGEYKIAASSADYQGIPASEYRFSAQDMVPEICDNTTVIPSDTTVIDERDNKSYTIRKMADGKCWFADNLDLDLSDSSVQQRMSSSNTNASATALGYLFQGGDTAEGAHAQYGFMTQDTFNSTFTTARDRSAAGHTTPVMFNKGSEPVDSNGFQYGYSYNYCAASAGSFCYGGYGPTLDGYNDAGQPVDQPDTSIDANEDICPTGWRLPYAGISTGEVYALATTYVNSDTALKFAFEIPAGSYWTSTMPVRYSESSMHILQVDNSSGQGSTTNTITGRKADNVRIRCIAK